jgi:hypothetical protein
VATAHLHGADDNDVTAWLGDTIPAWSVDGCDGNDLDACLFGKDLVIVGWDDKGSDPVEVRASVEAAAAAGTSVLYLHTWYEATGPLSDELSAMLAFSLPYGGNYWADDQADWDAVSETPADGEVGCYDPAIDSAERAVTHLRDADYSFDWSTCDDDKSCESVPDLVDEFYLGARAVRGFAQGFEQRAEDPFATVDRHRLEKLLVLLGDKYRERIAYPMVVDDTDDSALLEALFADHAALLTRQINPAQPDLGSFSPTIRDDHPTTSVDVDVTTRAVDFVTSTAVSALPGRTVTVTRLDDTDAWVGVRVNYLRDGSSHIFGDGYDRPAFLRSAVVPLTDSVELTSAYGGIVFLYVDDTETPLDVSVRLEGVAEHPVYRGPGTEEAFAAALDATELGWAELLTPSVEVHSRVDLMRETVASDPWAGDVAWLGELMWTWVYQDTWGLAGFVGEDLEHPSSVTAYCDDQGWDCTDPAIHGMRGVQHANADRALCGYGCSGNPYDMYWAFDPNSWGDSHEIGHNLQRSRLKVYGSASTEVSNNIFPVHKWWAYNKLGEADPYGRELDFAGVYAMLQAGQLTSDPVASVKIDLWEDGGVFQRLVFYWQLVMNNRDVAHLEDGGWDLVRLMHLHERLFSQAVRDDVVWADQQDALGFAGVTRADAEAIADHDYLLIAVSHITQRGHAAYFDAWGIETGVDARAQVEWLADAPLEFWVVPDETAFSDPLADPLPIDGT